MKPDRSFRAVPAALLAALLAVALPGAMPANGPPGEFCGDRCPPPESRSPILVVPPVDRFPQLEEQRSPLAENLVREVREVKKRFVQNRRKLPVIQGSNEQAYPRQEVAGLIAFTGKDLDQAIARVNERELVALRAWSAEAFWRIQQSPGLASVNAAAPQQGTINAEKSNGLLDQVGDVIGRIFYLATTDDLEVNLWVGSTPAPQATFRFWSKGQIKGTTPVPAIIRTNGTRRHVLRGLYSYRASLDNGPVAELITYPSPASDPADGLASERLDLVTGSSFFCCRFEAQYCRHVASEKECRP